jgi:peptidoglycan/LPS O-acetylase OafA/YrhL
LSDRKIASINGLRGVAIALVIVHHLFIPYYIREPARAVLFDQEGPLGVAIRNAAHGVDIFFVLSGFVLYLPYRLLVRSFDTRGDIWRFYRHRANRLVPLYAIVVIVGLVFHAQSPIGELKWFAELIGLSTALMDFSPHGFMPPSNIVLWSVGVEFWFSVLFPFLVLAIVRWGIWRVVVATTVVCLMFQAAGLLIAVERVGQFLPFTTGVAGKCFEFLFGMLVCDCYVRAADEGLTAARAVVGAIGGLVLCVAAIVLLDPGHSFWPRLIGIPLFAAGFSVFMLCVLLGPAALGWLSMPGTASSSTS